ncbi:hypothetical protein [Marinobacter halotolerans]|uniref:hypothetical protein n=1 Tax=Marinobacter halotolerans TaxID=1569211 RepID=UPI001CD93A82|nr:hypothetical protein [Marinobacter halotolerans]
MFPKTFSKNNHLKPFALLVSSSLLLSACSLGSDALEDAAGRSNSFPPAQNSLDDFTPSSTGDSSNSANLESNQIRVTLEVPASVAGEDGEETRRNLRIVEPESLEVYETDQSLNPLDYPNVRIQSAQNNRRIITFENGLPLAPTVIIEATYGGETLRSLAADADRDVKINPFSEYLASEVLSSYSSSELNRILDCVNDSEGSLCLNKYVWGTLADQVHDFEIDIPGTLNVPQAVSFLGERGDFASYVSSMAEYALLGRSSSGKISASSADYNTALWIAELGQTFRESTLAGSGQWGVRSATEKTVSDLNGTGYFYPGLTLTSFDVFGISVTSLASDIPYNRKTLIHTATDDFFERNAWKINTHSSSPGAATIEDNTRLLAGRALYQSITGQGSSETIGWTRNPYYLNAYVSEPAEGSEKPDRVVSGYFTAGKAIELVPESGDLKRDQLLEDHYMSVLELNLLQSEDFEIGTLNSRDYNVVYLATEIKECYPGNCEATEVMAIESGIGSWEISGDSVTQVLTTLSLARDNDGVVDPFVPDARNDSWLISERPSRVFSAGEGQILKSLGRLSLDRDEKSAPEEEPQVGKGATTPDGTLMAFNIDTTGIGKGLLIAAEEAGTSRPSTGRFRLQGIGMAMATGSNRLAHFNNALVTIQSSASAELSMKRFDVVHDVDAKTVSTPDAVDASSPISLAYTGSGSGSASFTTTDLTLEGFYTEDQNQFYLQVRQTTPDDQLLGLVVATRIPE